MFAQVSKFGFGAVARAAMAVSLVAAGGMIAAPSVAVAKDAAPKAGGNSKEFVAAAQAIQKTMMAGQALKTKNAPAADLTAALANAPAELQAAEAAIKTPTDRMLAGQWAVNLGGWINDIPMRQRGMKNMLDSGLVPANVVPEYQGYLGQWAMTNKDYATMTTALTAAVMGNAQDDNILLLLAQQYSRQKQPQQALDITKKAMEVRKAAGGKVPSIWIGNAAQVAYDNRMGQQAVDWSVALVNAEPTLHNWLAATQIVRDQTGLSNSEGIDASRLLDALGVFTSKEVAASSHQALVGEYFSYIQATQIGSAKTGFITLNNSELIKITDKGVAAGVLSRTDPSVADNYNDAKKNVVAELADLPAQERDARGPKATAKIVAAAADALLSNDKPAVAAELYAKALGMPGLANPDQVHLRNGIALYRSGKTAEASAELAKVGGKFKSIANLWSIFISQPKI